MKWQRDRYLRQGGGTPDVGGGLITHMVGKGVGGST